MCGWGGRIAWSSNNQEMKREDGTGNAKRGGSLRGANALEVPFEIMVFGFRAGFLRSLKFEVSPDLRTSPWELSSHDCQRPAA